MAKTPSTMLALGTLAPHFSLHDVISGKNISLTESSAHPATVIMFICNHCPYVKHASSQLSVLANDYMRKNVRFYAINSNDINNYPDDSPENMKRFALDEAFPFPYLFDETQEVARAYQAACTPDFFVFDKSLSLVYRGQLDDSRPGNHIPLSGNSIRIALDCILSGKSVPEVQKPSMGCNIKWKNH